MLGRRTTLFAIRGRADIEMTASVSRYGAFDPQETLRAITVGVGWARRAPSRCTNRNSGAALPILRLLNIRGAHVEDHSNPGFRAVFRRCTGDVGGRHPMVDHALGILAAEATRLAGLAFIIAGVPGLLDSFARFPLQGLGTPAPIAPPRNLVVSGLY